MAKIKTKTKKLIHWYKIICLNAQLDLEWHNQSIGTEKVDIPDHRAIPKIKKVTYSPLTTL